jgi:amino acid permease
VQPLVAQKNSESSELSYSKLEKSLQSIRTQSERQAQANMYKLFIGIALVAFPQTMYWVGIGLATISVIILTLVSIASSYFLLKARNKFKTHVVRDIADLGELCYGPPMRYFCQFILVLGQISLLVAYLIYLGTQAEQIARQLGHRNASVELCAFICTMFMTPAYLQKEYQTIAYFSTVFTAFSFLAILIIWTYDCIEIHD